MFNASTPTKQGADQEPVHSIDLSTNSLSPPEYHSQLKTFDVIEGKWML